MLHCHCHCSKPNEKSEEKTQDGAFFSKNIYLDYIFVVSSPVDPERHIYDFPPEVENDQKITQQQEGHATARQREGYKERYQRRREQNEKEKRHGCLNTDVLPYVPADHQQCQQSLNPGHAEAIVDTGRL